MKDPRRRSSVVPLPSDEEQRAALKVAAELSEPSAESSRRVLSRLEGADADLLRRRRRRRRRWTGVGGGVAAAAVITLVVLQMPDSPVADAPPPDPGSSLPAHVSSGYARVETVSPCAGITVEIRELTDLDLDWCSAGVLCLSLARGEIDVSVGPTFRPRTLRVLAGSVTVEVTGTRFTVSRHGERVSVAVTEGAVRVTWPDGSDTVVAGSYWTSWTDIAGAHGVESPAPVVSIPPANEGPARSTEDIATGDLPPLAHTESEVWLLATIQAQRGLGRPAEERLETLEEYLVAYPQNDSAEEVLALKVEALTQAGEYREAIGAARDYCLTYEEGPHREDVRWLEATTARDRLHDCELALTPYRELAEGVGARRAEARYYRGMCAFDTGRKEEARAALEAAMEDDLLPEQRAVARQILESLE